MTLNPLRLAHLSLDLSLGLAVRWATAGLGTAADVAFALAFGLAFHALPLVLYRADAPLGGRLRDAVFGVATGAVVLGAFWAGGRAITVADVVTSSAIFAAVGVAFYGPMARERTEQAAALDERA